MYETLFEKKHSLQSNENKNGLFASRWYRGVVMSCDGERNEIFFLDYGDTEWICSDLCYKLPKNMLEVRITQLKLKT